MTVDLSAIAKWPNVPACYDWLSLDRRGDWRLQGERVTHRGLIAFINRQAPHPEEARIWMDYLLSRRGQSVLNDTGLFSVRDDVSTSSRSASELRRQLGDAFRPIVISTGLLTYLDRMKRELFLENWDSAVSARPAPKPGHPGR